MGHKLDFREEHIVLVAKWWADRLREKKSEPSAIGSVPLSIASNLRQRLAPSEEKIVVFENKLADLLRTSETPGIHGERTAENWGIIGTRTVELAVDYHAQGLLLAAAKFAKISDMAFPWKTYMLMRYDRAVTIDSTGERSFLYGTEPTEESPD